MEATLGQNEKRLEQLDNNLHDVREQMSAKQREAPEPVPPDKELVPRTIAVLPFALVFNEKATDGDAVASYVTTALVNKLAENNELKVLPLNRIPGHARPKEQAKGYSWSDPQQVGRKLGAAYVLAGRMTSLSAGFESRLNVHIELIQVETGLLILSADVEIKSLEVNGPFQKEVDRVAAEAAQKVRAKNTGKE
jgi:TolB-like protein